MPRRDSVYGPAYQRARAKLLRSHPRCIYCGGVADSADHVPPVREHDHRVVGPCSCRLVASCLACQHLQGGLLRWRREQVALDDPAVIIEPPGFDVGDPVWDRPWLSELRDVPVDAVWPRLMSAPHPRAVGSFGLEFAGWVQSWQGQRLRWWQLLLSVRLLEHDDEGRLVWEALVLSLARQLGKSWWLRALFMWRIHQGARFGERQVVVHTGKDLSICKEVQEPARIYARARPDEFHVREVNGQEEIRFLEDESKWVLRAKEAVYGLSATMCGVDEAWKVTVSSIEEGIVPTMVEHEQAQLLLVSTAHRRATSLMMLRRAGCLERLAVPDADLLVEWSAPREVTDITQVSAWRMASPHWSERREGYIAGRLEAAQRGEASDDPDEPDPIESFRAQWLNQWPIRLAPAQGKGEPLVDVKAWQWCRRPVDVKHERLWVAVEDNYGQGAAVCAVALCEDDRLEVDGWLCESRDAALRDAVATLDEADVVGRLIVGKSIVTELDCDRAEARETRIGLPMVRSLLAGNRLVHDDAPELDDQLAVVRVREVSGGLGLVSGVRADLVRALAWALLAAAVREPVPAMHSI